MEQLASQTTSAHCHGPDVDSPFVSIIMPIRNEADFIERALRSILNTSYPAERMEIPCGINTRSCSMAG